VSWRTALAAVAVVVGSQSCQLLRPSASPGPAESARGGASAAARIELVNVAERPSLALVARDGDPRPALGFAAAHDHGSRASAALAALLEGRLVRLGLAPTDSRAHDLGFSVAILASSADQARRFISALAQAIAAPVTAGEPALAEVGTRFAALRARTWLGPGEAAAAACSGDAGVLTAPRESSEPSVAELETWRRSVHSSRAAAFSAVGPSGLLAAVTDAVERLEAWPGGAAPNDPWPAQDLVAVDPDRGERRLSFALRTADAAAAVEAARLLGNPSATLAARLAGFEPRWTLERVVGTTRPRGACLRIDLRGPRGEPPPPLADVARVALLIEEEAQRATARGRGNPSALDAGALRATDPREAAAVAAWRALAGRLEPGPERRVLSYVAAGESSSELGLVLERERAAATRPSLELRSRIEAGQGATWLLLASGCGTSGETDADAGHTALAIRAMTDPRAPGEVVLEPWITADGVGVLAHGPRRSSNESPEQHARRVAATLGRALLARLTGSEVAQARQRLLDELGPGPDSGYFSALEATAPGRPSWIEPRGTWVSVADASTHTVEVLRRAWLRSPLRLAVIANHDEPQARAAHDELERWLRPVRSSVASCRRAERPAAKAREVTVEVDANAEPRALAYVAVPLPSGPPAEAHWTAWLLNRPSGWLDRTLHQPGLAAGARARVLGGSSAAALVIEIGALEEQSARAVQQVRALLERLSKGALRAEDVELARAELAQARESASLDPRRRIVDLWVGHEARQPTLDSLRRFQRALTPASHVVVLVKRKE
jgi:hypothetical protein